MKRSIIPLVQLDFWGASAPIFLAEKEGMGEQLHGERADVFRKIVRLVLQQLIENVA